MRPRSVRVDSESSDENGELPLGKKLKEEEISCEDFDSDEPLSYSLTEPTSVKKSSRNRPAVEIEVDDKTSLTPQNSTEFQDIFQEIQSTSKQDVANCSITPAPAHPIHYFFLSLLPELESITEKQRRRFQIRVLQLIDDIKRNE